MLWSDPTDEDAGWVLSNRGAGFLFGSGVHRKFLAANGLELTVRSHQLAMDGYQFHFRESLLTIWSAPNYCNRCGNSAAVVRVGGEESTSLLGFGEP